MPDPSTNPPLPDQLASKDQDRLRAYRERLDFYNGVQWLTQSRKERQLTFNYAKTGIDKVTSYLMSGLDFAVEARDDSEAGKTMARAAEQALYCVYQENALEALDFETEVDAAILGDAAYKVTWDTQEKRVRVTSADAQGIFAWWRADDPGQVTRVAQRYTVPAGSAGATAQSPDKDQTVIEDWTPATYDLYVDGQPVFAGLNPYGFIPYVLFPNLREPKKFWGLSDIPAIMETQRELNRAISQLSRILEVSGNPIAVLENVAESEDIAIQPNAVWNIPEGAKAYLLDLLQGGGIRLHIDYIDVLYRTLHDLSETPRAAFGGIERELSGVALEIELHPLLQRVKRKRTIRTAAYRRRAQMILTLLSKFAGASFGDNAVRIVWGKVLPQDSQRSSQTEQLLVQSGIHSRRRAMDDMGIMDPEREFERWLEERGKIMEQNQRLQARFSRGGQRERAQETPDEPA